MKTDMAPARPALRDGGALLRQAEMQARQAMAVPALVRQHLLPESAQALREDDLSLMGGFIDSIAARLSEALAVDGDPVEPGDLVRHVVLAHAPTARLVHARAVEARLCRHSGLVGLHVPELPSRIESQVSDAQDELAEAAMALIIAQSRFLSRAQAFALDLDEFPPEILHGLVRLALAWLQGQPGADPLALAGASDALLQGFDERCGRPHRLMRFCHLFALPRAGDDWSLADNGPSLVMAMVERASDLPSDLLFDMLRDPDMARLAVVLRACGLEPDTAARLLQGLAMIASLRVEDVPAAADLRALPSDDAARLLALWRNLAPDSLPGTGW